MLNSAYSSLSFFCCFKKESMARLLVGLCSFREGNSALTIIRKLVYIFYPVFSFPCGMGSIQFCYYILPTTQALVSFLNSSKFRGPQLKKNGNEWIIKHNLFKNCNLQFNLMKMLLMSEILKILRFLKFVFSLRHLNL